MEQQWERREIMELNVITAEYESGILNEVLNAFRARSRAPSLIYTY
jgi:hypothetical protein